MNTKVVGTLISMAVLSAIVYVFALFSIPFAHAADVIVYEKVAIEDGSLRSLAVDLPGVSSVSNVSVDTSSTDINAQASTNMKMDAQVVSPAPSTVNSTSESTSESNSTASTTIDSRFSISSTTDLDTYTRDITDEDDNVSNIIVKEDSVAVSYKEPAKIFGFIPTEMTVTIVAHNDGTVTVDYPWYAFLAGKNEGSLKPGLQARIGQILRTSDLTPNLSATSTTGVTASTTVSTDESLSPHVRAELIHAIHNALVEYRANGTASTTVETEM